MRVTRLLFLGFSKSRLIPYLSLPMVRTYVTFMESIGVLAMVILGGMGSIPGAVLGATIVTVLNLQVLTELSLRLSALRQSGGLMPLLGIPWTQFPNQLEPAKYQRMVFGIVLIVMMIFRTEGLLPAVRRRLEIQEALHGDADDADQPAKEA